MSKNSTTYFDDLKACVEAIVERVGPNIVFGSPLALGKPNHIVNGLYRRALEDRGIHLTILGGLSIERPRPKNDLERRFLEPFLDRIFGDYPDLEYVKPYRRSTLPPNVEVAEFFLRAGSFLRSTSAQQEYLSSNYTHVGRDLFIQGLNVFGQSVARRNANGCITFSVSSNSDSLNILPEVRACAKRGERVVSVAQVNERLPFMPNDAQVSEQTYDFVLDNRSYDHTLLGTPALPVEPADYAIGMNASTLVRDGGTLQIGIGSLGDAIAYACCLRHEQNDIYLDTLDALNWRDRWGRIADAFGGTAPFELGLYGASEMFTDGFFHLMDRGVLKREVYDDITIQTLVNEGRLGPAIDEGVLGMLLERGAIAPRLSESDVEYLKHFGILREDVQLESSQLVSVDGSRIDANLLAAENRRAIEATCIGDALRAGVVLHGGFYLGPPRMYQALHEMGEAGRRRINMTGIQFINELFGHEALASAQRQHARFMNTAMMVTLLGAACSDGLETGQIVSGVGGQYNFVAQAHALAGARSLLLLRATREKLGNVTSNIVWNYGHTTIPRHLRDIVVTEYGVADLRGKRDREVIASMLEIADSRFQDELIETAKAAGKLPRDYRLPEHARDNTPERLSRAFEKARALDCFPVFPFGSDFTPEELVLAKVLKRLKAKTANKRQLLGTLLGMVDFVGDVPDAAVPYLARLGLDRPGDINERIMQKVILSELQAGGHI